MLTSSDKHSQFSTTFPIYIKERKMVKKPLEPKDEEDEDADEDTEKQQDKGPDDFTMEENWVRVNDKAPIWMRCVLDLISMPHALRHATCADSRAGNMQESVLMIQ